MTTLMEWFATCANCNTTLEGMGISSTNALGAMDLDMRPPPDERDTLDDQIQLCPSCGYCAPSIGEAEGVDFGILSTPAYRNALNDDRYPALANQFLAYAQLARAGGDTVRVVWATLRAAWVCDDNGSTCEENARDCRRWALDALDILNLSGKTFSDDISSDAILRADLLRRSRQFAAALAAAETLQSKDLPEMLLKIASFQRQQARLEVADCFTVDDALQS